MKLGTSGRLLAAAGAALLLGGGARADGIATVDGARIAQADRSPGDWMSVGRSYGEQRFSPLDEINADNAARLGLGWFADLETTRGQEGTPLAVDGTLYVSTAWDIVKAYDGATGRLKWSYDPEVPRSILIKICCDAVNRGLAAWQGKLFIGTLDGRLIALDAATGRVVWSTLTIDPAKPYTITGAPRVVEGRVIIGNSGSEFGVRGYVSAYDAATGKLDWRFYTVPGDPSKPAENAAMAKAAKTWHGEWWKSGGGGTVWNALSYDPALGLLYFGTANGVTWNRGKRSPGGGDNLYVASIVALDARTGAYRWHYQTTPGEEWDFDATEDLVQADLTIDGKPRQVIMQANKNGFYYVLDRKTGALLSAAPFVPVNWASGIDPRSGRPIENPKARYETTHELWLSQPGPLGGHAWQAMAFSPMTGLAYIPAQESSFPYLPAPDDYRDLPLGVNFGLDLGKMSMKHDPASVKAALEGTKGYLLAWDPVKQKEAWRAPYPGPWNGGVLATAGNIVAEGSAAGDFAVFRADTGARLWSISAQSAVMGGPIAYQAGGEEYIAVLSGWGGSYPLTYGEVARKSGNLRNVSRVLVFKLGGTATLPPLAPLAEAPLEPPRSTADPAVVEAGKGLYARFCSSCHGEGVVTGGLTPDLLRTGFLADDGFFDIVLGGRLQDQGMVSFSSVLDHDKAAAIRAYIIARANEDKAREAAAK